MQVDRPADFEEVDDEQVEHVGFSQRRNAALQRSQDSGALTDWSGGSRGSPTRQSCHSSHDSLEEHKYVTVLSVNGGLDLNQVLPKAQDPVPDFVTVLSVGALKEADEEETGVVVGSVCLSLAGFVEETACICRQAGHKLGFGLKFDGGSESDQPIERLFVQCCAEGSPASKVRCSWGRLVEADEIIEIDGVDIRNTLNRLQVVSKLKDGQDVLSLKIRHYWDESKRTGIMEQLNNNNTSPKPVLPVARKSSVRQQQERAVDVPEELLIQSVSRRKDATKGEDAPPPVPPRRKRRAKLHLRGTNLTSSGGGSAVKPAVCRSLSSDQVLINGHRVAASGAVAVPSKPPRNNRPRSLNAKHNKDGQTNIPAPATLPRTKDFSQAPEPKERRQNSVVIVNAGCSEPQPAEVYINLIAEEDKRMSMDTATESESESSSSVSTVVDTWSVSSSSGDPFGDFSEQEEFRRRTENSNLVNEAETTAEIQVEGDSTLTVLIEPPDTFLDHHQTTSISPSSSDGHQDASSDSGASSGGSELHLAESDEELRAFQQMESALEMGHDCDAISLPIDKVSEEVDGGAIERMQLAVVISDTCTSVVEPNKRRMKEASSEPESPAKVVENHPTPSITTTTNSSSINKKGSRSNLNRTPLRSRIPQAVTTQRPAPATTPTKTGGVVGRVTRPVANNKTSGIVAPKVVKPITVAPLVAVRQHNNNSVSSGSRLATSRTTTTATTPTSSSHQRTSGENKPAATSPASSSNLLKSVKPGLTPVSTQPSSTSSSSKIPRPSSGAQLKSSPSVPSARPLTAASSAHPIRHPSSSSLLPRTASAAMAGVKPSSSPLHKSTSRLQLTHNKEGARLTERPENMAATCKSYAAYSPTTGTSPPSSRLPPDGHEFPGDYMDDSSHRESSKSTGRGRSGSGVWRASHNGRDERSERSVKDKIALFTNDAAPTPPVATAPVSRHSAVSAKPKYPTLSCSVDNLSVGRSPMVSPVIRPDVRTLPRHQLATPAVKTSNTITIDRDAANLSERSRSMLDVAHYSPPPVTGGQRHSAGLVSPTERKSSLVNLVADSRRKLSLSNSKLRGLVIPDVVDGTQSGSEPSRAVIDLPEIISKDSVMVVGLSPFAPLRSPNGLHAGNLGGGHDVTDSVQQQKTTSLLSSLPWKSNSPSLPKYSPAFKRKELTVLRTPYSSSEPMPVSPKPPLLASFSCPSDVDGSSSVAEESGANNSDTDGDSAVSSSRSSFSPSGSPVPDRNSSGEETTASRVLKAQSVEALNRKNVLQSARYSSGGGNGHLDLVVPPPSPPAVPPPPSPEVKLTQAVTVDVNQQTTAHASLASPALRSTQRNNKLSGDFEQTLKKFTSAEASSRIERSSPRLRLSSSERLEVKTALITDVCSDATTPTKVASPFLRDASPSTKKSTSSGSVDHHSSSGAATTKEIKSFRALAERWEAIASETPASSGSSPPSPNIATSKKQEQPAQPPSVDERDESPTIPMTTTSRTTPTARAVTSRSVSAGVVEIRKAFERVKEELETESNCNYGRECAGGSLEDYKQHHSLFSLQQPLSSSHYHQHVRMSSLDSTTSEDSSLPFGFGYGFGGGGYGGYYGGPFGIGVRDNYGSITSLASSTSLISPQELQQLLDEANQSLEESGTPSHEIVVVVLHRGDVASSLSPGLGITLAGGADYETKEITIHKVIVGSVADRDGRIQKGDRVLSINGKGLKGVTHREALAILKAPRPEVVLVLSRNRSVSPQDICHDVDKDLPPVMIPASNTGLLGNPRTSHILLSGNGSGISRPPRILESPSDFTNYDLANEEDHSRGPPVQTTLVKDGAGLGFSLEGGKDSPLGDRPLTIKKIFTGGAASKNSTLRVGDQIISVNGCDVTSMSRIEAWNLMKKLPDGAVSLIIRQQITSS